MKREREIKQALGLPDGYTLSRLNGGHYQIVRPDGSPLRSAQGIPLQAAYSPSDWRGMKNLRRTIRHALQTETAPEGAVSHRQKE